MSKANQKKSSLLGKLFVGAGLFATANMAGGMWLGHKNMEKMEQQGDGQNNLANNNILKKGEIKVKADTNNAYIVCMTSKMDIFFPVPEQKKMNVELTSYLSNVKLHIPKNVKITCEGEMASGRRIYEIKKENMPEIHFVFKNKVSEIKFVHD